MRNAVLLRLDIRANIAQLTGPGLDVSERHNGLTQELLDSISEVQRARRRLLDRVPNPAAVPSLRAVGRLLGEALLPGRVAAGLIAQLGEARRVYIALTSETYAGLPWEAVTLPGSEVPLVLCPGVQLFRTGTQAERRPALRGGPLRIAFAIAAPTENGGALLDYERELRDIEEAVRQARAAGLELTVVRYATLGSLRSCVQSVQPHVLHVSTHGGPGSLTLEDDEGSARAVGADEFVAEALGAGPVPELVCLAACFTSAEAAARPAILRRPGRAKRRQGGRRNADIGHRPILDSLLHPPIQRARHRLHGPRGRDRRCPAGRPRATERPRRTPAATDRPAGRVGHRHAQHHRRDADPQLRRRDRGCPGRSSGT